MSSFLDRILGRPRTAYDAKVATLQLRLLVAMAAVDDRIDLAEAEQIADFVDRMAPSDREHGRLHAKLDELLEAPPRLDDVLHELSRHAHNRDLSRGMVHELSEVAKSDHSIDHREEFLLDMVCDIFRMPRRELISDEHDDELHDFLHRLASAGRRAA